MGSKERECSISAIQPEEPAALFRSGGIVIGEPLPAIREMLHRDSRQNVIDKYSVPQRRLPLFDPVASALLAIELIMDDAVASDDSQSDDTLALHTPLRRPYQKSSPGRSTTQCSDNLEDHHCGHRTGLADRIGSDETPTQFLLMSPHIRLASLEIERVRFWDRLGNCRLLLRGGLSEHNSRNNVAIGIPSTTSPDRLPSAALTIDQTTGNTEAPSRSLRSRFSRYLRTKQRAKYVRAQSINRQAAQLRSQGQEPHT